MTTMQMSQVKACDEQRPLEPIKGRSKMADLSLASLNLPTSHAPQALLAFPTAVFTGWAQQATGYESTARTSIDVSVELSVDAQTDHFLPRKPPNSCFPQVYGHNSKLTVTRIDNTGHGTQLNCQDRSKLSNNTTYGCQSHSLAPQSKQHASQLDCFTSTQNLSTVLSTATSSISTNRPRSRAIAIKRNCSQIAPWDEESSDSKSSERMYDWATWRMYNRIIDHRQKYPVNESYRYSVEVSGHQLDHQSFPDLDGCLPLPCGKHTSLHAATQEYEMEGEVFELEI